MSEMFQKDDVFIVLIRTQKNAEGTRMRAWSGAGVRVSEMCTGHHLTTAVAHQPQLRVCFPNHETEIPTPIIPHNISFPIFKELFSQYSHPIIYL